MPEPMIETTELRLVGPDGSIGARFVAGNHNTMSAQIGKPGSERGIMIRVEEDGTAQISLTTPDGYSRIALRVDGKDELCYIALGNAENKPTLSCFATQSMSSVTLHGLKGDVRLRLGLDQETPSIEMLPPDSEPRRL